VNDGDVFVGTVLRATLGESKGKGTPYIGLVVRMPDGDELRGDIWLTDKALGRARRQLKVLGFDIDAHDLDAVETALVGQTADFRVESDDWNGQVRYKASVVTSESSVDPAKIASLTARLRAAKGGGQGRGEDRPPEDRRNAAPPPRSAAPAPRAAPATPAAPRMPGEGVREAAAQARADAAANPTPPAKKPGDFKMPDIDLGDVPFLWFLPLLALFN